MGDRGPAPTPTTILAKEGGWRAKHRADSAGPAFPRGRPRKPVTVEREQYARTVWYELVALLDNAGIVTEADRHALARLCNNIALERTILEQIRETGIQSIEYDDSGEIVRIRANPLLSRLTAVQTQIRKDESLFGLNPAARARIQTGIAEHDQSADPFDNYLDELG